VFDLFHIRDCYFPYLYVPGHVEPRGVHALLHSFGLLLPAHPWAEILHSFTVYKDIYFHSVVPQSVLRSMRD